MEERLFLSLKALTLQALFSEHRVRIRSAMRREMRSLATKFSNYQQNRLTVRVVPFQNERFVDRNVHLH